MIDVKAASDRDVLHILVDDVLLGIALQAVAKSPRLLRASPTGRPHGVSRVQRPHRPSHKRHVANAETSDAPDADNPPKLALLDGESLSLCSRY